MTLAFSMPFSRISKKACAAPPSRPRPCKTIAPRSREEIAAGRSLSVPRDLDWKVRRCRLDDRLEGPDAMQYLVGGDRVGRLAAYRRGKCLQLGENGVEPAMLDDASTSARMALNPRCSMISGAGWAWRPAGIASGVAVK